MIYANFVDSVDSTGARFTGIQLAPDASDPSFTAYDVPDTGWFVLDANNVIGTRDPASVVAPPQPNPAIAVIDAQLAALDIKRIRPVAEGDTAYLATLNQQAADLRAQRALLPLTT